jgi:hypothetical protein
MTPPVPGSHLKVGTGRSATNTVMEEGMNDRSTRNKLLGLASTTSTPTRSANPADAGLFWARRCATSWASPTTWRSNR